MAAKKSSEAMDFIVECLKGNRAASYADIAEAAGKKRLKIYPIMYGRAQALLGIVKSAKRGEGKAAKAKAGKAKAGKPVKGKRGPGRPRAAAFTTFDGTIEGIVAAVKSSEQAKAKYRAALERIQTILADVLA
ncbi:MAG: hypothetical protein FJ265_06970 [Planctomycetes bacterium]|nr:hypothetical protein [Planctomycetota bacterium]